MNSIRQYKEIFITCLLAIWLTGCSDDDYVGKNHSEFKEAIAGEWYAAVERDDNYLERYIFEFGEDNSYSITYSSVNRQDYIYEKGEGSYSLNGKSLKQSYIMYGTQMSGDYEVRSVGKYDMHLFLKSTLLEETDYRIVETIYMKVGETADVSINDPDFYPDSYISDDERVVEVYNTGTILAKRQGTAYIIVQSSIGTAAIRVVVEAETYIDDILVYLDEQISNVTDAYGELFSEFVNQNTGQNMRKYFLLDDKVQQLLFGYDEKGIVKNATLVLRKLTDMEKVMNIFYKIYYFEAEQDGIKYYSTTKNARRVKILIRESSREIGYIFENNNDPILIMDNLVNKLITKTASEAFSLLGLTVTDEDREMGCIFLDLNNSFFRDLIIEFEPYSDVISRISLLTVEGVTFNDLDEWYGKHYILTGYDEEDSYRYINFSPRFGIQFERADKSFFVNYELFI